MKKGWLVAGLGAMAAFAGAVQAAPGEWWEITAKMEMPGMPFAMPGQTNKVCLPKGGEADPSRTQGKDSNCKMTDVQRSGNTVKYKGTCVNNGETMNMVGETTHDGNSFKSNMKMTGKSHGEPVNMAMTSSGKRIGGACDTEEMARKGKAQADEYRQQAELAQKQSEANNAKLCDVSDSDKLLTTSSYHLGPAPMCKNSKEYCQAVKKKISHDPDAYQQLINQDEQQKKLAAGQKVNANDFMVTRMCSLDMASLKKTLCKNLVHSGPQEFMDKNCSPAEAKEYREFAREHEDCGRDYTSPDQRAACINLAKCGATDCGSTDDTARKDAGKSKADKSSADSSGVSSDTVLQGAKKLKGLFGF
ncbi:MAG TPA: DUF3617 domain-containing protein [Gallionellaceae bacterium]